MLPDDPKVRRAKKVVDAGMNIPLAQLQEGIETVDAVKEVSKNILELNENLTSKIVSEGQIAIEIEKDDFEEYMSSVSLSNGEVLEEVLSKLNELVEKDKEIQKVEIVNHKEKDDSEIRQFLKKISEKELSVKAPIVNVDAPIVELNNEETNKILSQIEENTRKTEDLDRVVLVDTKGKPINFNLEPKVVVSGGGGIPDSITRDIRTMASNYATRLDTVSTAGVTYVGKSTIGTATSSPSWQIMKMDETGTPVTLITTWADGNDLFDNVWDNRTSLTYL